jgi:hypothetical protein
MVSKIFSVGSTDILERLMADSVLYGNMRAREGLDEIRLLFEYLSEFNIVPQVCCSTTQCIFNY